MCHVCSGEHCVRLGLMLSNGRWQGAKDFRADADLYAACNADAKIVCKGVKSGEGRIQACLVCYI
jgi:hypothetical protein